MNVKYCVALLLAAVAGRADALQIYCVNDGDFLGYVLQATSDGGATSNDDTLIKIATGTYSDSGNEYGYHNTKGHSLVIEGGYDAACTTRITTAASATILDGGSALPVLNVRSTGNVTIRYLTFQHGVIHGADGGGVSLDVDASSGVGPTFLFENNQVLRNSSDYGVGGLIVFGKGTIRIVGNLFAHNSAPFAGAVSVQMDSGSVVDFVNNTVANNIETVTGNQLIQLGTSGVAGLVTNNLVYGNSGTYDIQVYSATMLAFSYNDYHTINGSPASRAHEFDVNPKFVNAGLDNFHLSSTSTLLGVGALPPSADFPLTDLDGHPRTFAGKIDLGAYQFGDGIFLSGFDR
jgi:hypothetical protein